VTATTDRPPAPPAVPLSLGRAARLERRDLGESAAYLTVEGDESAVTLGFSLCQLAGLALGRPAPGVRQLLARVAYLTGGAWAREDRRGLEALARAALRGRGR
jgi:hypothetical protein